METNKFKRLEVKILIIEKITLFFIESMFQVQYVVFRKK